MSFMLTESDFANSDRMLQPTRAVSCLTDTGFKDLKVQNRRSQHKEWWINCCMLYIKIGFEIQCCWCEAFPGDHSRWNWIKGLYLLSDQVNPHAPHQKAPLYPTYTSQLLPFPIFRGILSTGKIIHRYKSHVLNPILCWNPVTLPTVCSFCL